jgi:hypothetical protein
MEDLSHFIASYTDADEHRIRFAWNGKHADEFSDANYDFRKKVLEAVLQQPDAAPLSLVRDLFRAETELSREVWCVDNRVATLAEIMLTRGGRASLIEFLRGKCQSFDASMACGGIRIDRRLAKDLHDEATRLLRKCNDDRERKLLEVGRVTFAERAFGSGSFTSPPAAQTKPPKLRWYQWRLRSMFILTLVVAIGMSWLTAYVARGDACISPTIPSKPRIVSNL